MHIEDSKLNIDVFLSEQQIQVVDQASGMTHEQMKIHLAEVGATNVDEEQRGFFGRGANSEKRQLAQFSGTEVFLSRVLQDFLNKALHVFFLASSFLVAFWCTL